MTATLNRFPRKDSLLWVGGVFQEKLRFIQPNVLRAAIFSPRKCVWHKSALRSLLEASLPSCYDVGICGLYCFPEVWVCLSPWVGGRVLPTRNWWMLLASLQKQRHLRRPSRRLQVGVLAGRRAPPVSASAHPSLNKCRKSSNMSFQWWQR